MAITSVFYDTAAGTPASLVDEIKWAHAHPQIGSSKYGVDGVTDFQVTAHPTIANTVNVAIGKAWGHGVWVESDAVIPVTCTAPGAGATRWDMICIRRDWTGAVGGPSTVVAVEGGTVGLLPAGRQNIPGTIDDQPIALVQWTAGSGTPTALRDLRCWGGDGGIWAVDDLVRQYLTRPGTVVNVAGILWQYTIGSTETTPSWAVTYPGGVTGAAWTYLGHTGYNPLFGYGSALEGTPSPGQIGFKIQAGTQVKTTDANGYSQVVFPRPFPNGLLTVVLTNGDASIDRLRGGGTLTMSVSGLPWDTGHKHAVTYQVAMPTGMATNQIHRLNWVALGW